VDLGDWLDPPGGTGAVKHGKSLVFGCERRFGRVQVGVSGAFSSARIRWRSQPAILRLKQAVSEIKRVARRDAVHAADGAVSLLERLSPALENVDSSSGAIGTAINNAIEQLVLIIAAPPADARTRDKWLERLWTAYEGDEIPYLEQLVTAGGDCAPPSSSPRCGLTD
jgi:hypothetical protein